MPEASPAWRDRGRYLITGGGGGIARLLARDLARRTTGSSVMLGGRRPLDATIEELLDELRGAGARAQYQRVNLEKQNEVDALVASLRGEYGGLDGIVHCAGITEDAYLLSKTDIGIRRVLAPKVQGTINLGPRNERRAARLLRAVLVRSSSNGPPRSGGLRGGKRLHGRILRLPQRPGGHRGTVRDERARSTGASGGTAR